MVNVKLTTCKAPKYFVLGKPGFLRLARFYHLLSRLPGVLFAYQACPPEELIEGYNQFELNDSGAAIIDQGRLCREILEGLTLSNYLGPYSKHVDPVEAKNIIGQRIVSQYGRVFTTARICQKIYGPSRMKFILPAPTIIRQTFQTYGVPIAPFWSSAAWSLEVFCDIFLMIPTASKAAGRLILDFIKLRGRVENRADLSEVFWIDTSPTEWGTGADELNIPEFIKARKLPVFQNKPKIWIVNPTATKDESIPNENIVIGRNKFRIVGRKSMMIGELFVGLFHILQLSLVVIRKVLLCESWILLIGREIVDLPREYGWFSSVKPKGLLFSLSLAGDQPLWLVLRKYINCEMTMLFYAACVDDVHYKGEPSYVPTEFLFLVADKIAVWNGDQKNWYESMGYDKNKIINCGPIIFSRYPKLKKTKSSTARILIYDMSPVTSSFQISYGIALPFLKAKNTNKYINDIVESCFKVFGKKFKIFIKSKAQSGGNVYEGSHLQSLKELATRNQQVEILPLKISPLVAVENVDAVLTFPFSSPGQIAYHYGIPSAYYTPTELVVRNPIVPQAIPLLKNLGELEQWLGETIHG